MSEITATIPRAVGLDATNWMKVQFTDSGNVLLQCRSDVDVYLANQANPGGAYWTIKAGNSLVLGINTPDFELWAKAASGPVELEILYLSPGA